MGVAIVGRLVSRYLDNGLTLEVTRLCTTGEKNACQFAEILERGGGVCRPEPELAAERAAWEIGWNAYLAVECCAGQWDYKLFDGKFNETKSGSLEVVGCCWRTVPSSVRGVSRLR